MLYILADLFKDGEGIAGNLCFALLFADREEHNLITVDEYSADAILLADLLGNIKDSEQLQIMVTGITQRYGPPRSGFPALPRADIVNADHRGLKLLTGKVDAVFRALVSDFLQRQPAGHQ
ncbi:hypothetical protein D3C81_1872260 [compost metagenome]